MRNYPDRPVPGKSFKGVKKLTVPNQSMSLQEIIRRFTRNESLPIKQQGVYDTRFGDIEKIAKMDIYDQHEHMKAHRTMLKAWEKELTKKSEPPAPPALPLSAPPAQ